MTRLAGTDKKYKSKRRIKAEAKISEFAEHHQIKTVFYDSTIDTYFLVMPGYTFDHALEEELKGLERRLFLSSRPRIFCISDNPAGPKPEDLTRIYEKK